MFRHVAIFRLDPLVLREKNAFCNALLIYNDWKGGGRDLVSQSVGGFFGVCWVCRMFDVGPLAWRLQALWCGRCSWAGPCVFGVHRVLWGFRSGSVDVLYVVFCSIMCAARVKKLHCWCGFTYEGFATGAHLNAVLCSSYSYLLGRRPNLWGSSDTTVTYFGMLDWYLLIDLGKICYFC
jgi:hypothetical protein